MSIPVLYHENRLLDALEYLHQHSDVAQSKDGEGLNKIDFQSGFVRSCLERKRSNSGLTDKMLDALYRVILRYQKQLENNNITLPSKLDVAKEVEQKQKAGAIAKPSVSETRKNPTVDIVKTHIHIFCPYSQKIIIDELRAELRIENISCNFNPATKEWDIPFSEKIFALATRPKFFPQGVAEYLEGAKAYVQQKQEAAIAEMMAQAQHKESREKEVQELLAVLGGLDTEVAPGITLYAHQKEAIRLAFEKTRLIVADQVGLGKTLEAAVAATAYQKLYGYRVYVVSTKSSLGMWRETCQNLNVYSEFFTWESISGFTFKPEDWPDKYVLIADEAHKAQNVDAQRTKSLLKWCDHKNCKGVFLLTGTPKKNGRPINTYPLLLAVHHPSVWHTEAAVIKRCKNEYVRKYCGAKQVKIGGKYHTDTTGATNLAMWHRLFIHDFSATQNHSSACIIARLKQDCLDLPEKQRVMYPVELSTEATDMFHAACKKMFEDYEQRVQEKLEAFKQKLLQEMQENDEKEKEYNEVENVFQEDNELRELLGEEGYETWVGESAVQTQTVFQRKVEREEQRIRTAQAIVAYGIFRHAGAIAKLESAFELIKTILEDSPKAVVFTTFVDVARLLGERIERELGVRVGYILGDVKEADRNKAIQDFQSDSGNLSVMICSSAGQEAITLTGTKNKPCQYMVIIDRAWTPGDVEQQEARCHRISLQGQLTVFWLQLPEGLTDVDMRVDALLQEKQQNIDKALYGKDTGGMEFSMPKELTSIAQSIFAQTRKSRQKILV